MNLGTLLEEIERDEGYRQFPYKDTADPPRLTIGFGFNLDDVGFSREECQLIAAHRLRKLVSDLRREIPWFETLSERRQNALVNMAYQMGVAGLMAFKNMLTALRAQDFAAAAAEALDSKWARQVPNRAARVAKMLEEG